MAIFNNETQFYSQPAPGFVHDQPFISRFVDFVADHVFAMTLPLSILAYSLNGQLKAAPNLVYVLGGLTGMYLGMIGCPALVALLLASPTLLAWKKHKHRLFKRVFETIFVFLYLLLVIGAMISSFLPTATK